jgi:hypothetical protein
MLKALYNKKFLKDTYKRKSSAEVEIPAGMKCMVFIAQE